MTLDPKIAGDLVYVLGHTRDELGASEYYDMLGYVGRNVPQVFPEQFFPLYRALAQAILKGLTASVHGVYRGGLGVHLALMAMAGEMGLQIDLSAVPAQDVQRDDVLLKFTSQLYVADGSIVDYTVSNFIPGYFNFHVNRRIGNGIAVSNGGN